MKKINVLVLGVGGNVGQGIITALRVSKLPIKIIGACVSSDSLGLYMSDTAYVSPYASDKTFIDWVIDVCNKESVSIIFTGVEEIIFELEINKEKLQNKTGSVFISSEIEKLKIANNKFLTAKFLQENGLNFPKSENLTNSEAVKELIEDCGFPLIAKPNMGKGSMGIVKLNSEKDLDLIPDDNYCLQEYLGDENNEFTVGCYVDKSGNQKGMIIFRRKLKYGTTFMAEIVENKIIEDECRKICSAFKPRGPLNIQLRLHKGKPICFELNARYSGTAPIRAKFGYNDVEAMIKEYVTEENIENLLNPAKKGKVYRYFNEFYIDLQMQEKLNEVGLIKNTSIYRNYQENKK
jgi:carbamoyl-phosphate synthase large subunit